MADIHTHNAALQAKSPSDWYFDTLSERLPQMRRLFENLAAGATPNFLDMIAVLSEMSDYMTDYDQNGEPVDFDEEIRSQNKCRFCS